MSSLKNKKQGNRTTIGPDQRNLLNISEEFRNYSCPDPCSRRIARRSIPNCSAFL